MNRQKTKDILIPMTKNTVRLIQQTQTKAQETLEKKLSKSTESFPFVIPLQVKNGEGMLN